MTTVAQKTWRLNGRFPFLDLGSTICLNIGIFEKGLAAWLADNRPMLKSDSR